MESDFPRITMERMREVMAKRDVWASTALNARFNYNTDRGLGSCSCCGESKVCADWLPSYQVCSECFNAALPENEQWRRKMSKDEAAAVKFYADNPCAALADFSKRAHGVALPVTDLVVKGWYAALADARLAARKAGNDWLVDKLDEIHQRLLATDGVMASDGSKPE